MKAGMYHVLKNVIEAVYCSYGKDIPKIELYDDDTVTISFEKGEFIKSDGVYEGSGESIDK